MIHITGTTEWKAAHPGAVIGLLELAGVDNTQPSPELNQIKRETEHRLRQAYSDYSRRELLVLPVMAAYENYYKRFDKTYHVQLQVESIVQKGKNLPDVSPLVDANFCAEVETFVLTAGHDADKLVEPVVIDVSRPGDELAPLSGPVRPIRSGDMVMRDKDGISCSILYGQDNRSPITPQTRHVLYVAYSPRGVPPEVVENHLKRVELYVRTFSHDARLEQSRLLRA